MKENKICSRVISVALVIGFVMAGCASTEHIYQGQVDVGVPIKD
jgi:hypothetical protein